MKRERARVRTLTVFSFVATAATRRAYRRSLQTSTNESGEKPPKVSRSSSCISGAGNLVLGLFGLSTFTHIHVDYRLLEIGGSAIGSGKYCTSTSFSSAVRKQVVDALIKVDAAIIAAESEPLDWMDSSPVGPGPNLKLLLDRGLPGLGQGRARGARPRG